MTLKTTRESLNLLQREISAYLEISTRQWQRYEAANIAPRHIHLALIGLESVLKNI